MARNHRSHYFGGDEKARIEIIPMIDVMMFLLVFFVLIMTEMIQGAGIKLDLPQSSTAQNMETVKITVGVTQDGKLLLEGKAIEEPLLTAKLRELLQTKKVDVVIAGEKATRYQDIVKVMDLCRATGIVAIGLATQTG
ncbi:biopolymer transporter ExbD [Aquabacterium sp. A7-Y]|uniref:ExbD/TolR family protein n=1 Tax=Aquabacterium sp. A7-Y TaxID=1349605 RepID=UPI00223E3EE6|nr:biopolymer transporter ExbD [Aquabacterium sp. A7-Y]MCW7541522.1 biopolymer transporter ExbD [Aquabacterium sp. A7-Y]